MTITTNTDGQPLSQTFIDRAQAGVQTGLCARLTVSWPGSGAAGYVDMSAALVDFRVGRALTTSLPAGTLTVGGYPSADATFKLGPTLADGRPTTWLLHPWSTSSPLWQADIYGVPVRLDIGYDNLPGRTTPELVTVFTGRLHSREVRGGTCTLTAWDPRDDLGDLPQLPSTAANSVATWPASVTGVEMWAAGYLPGLTSLWPLTYILRANGIYSSPPPRPRCIFYQSNHGSAWPEIGSEATGTIGYDIDTTATPDDLADMMVPGRWGSQIVPRSSAVWSMAVPLNDVARFYFEEWVKVPDIMPSQGDGAQWLQLWVHNHQQVEDRSGDSFGLNIDGDAAGGLIFWASALRGTTPTLPGSTASASTFSSKYPVTAGWHMLSATVVYGETNIVFKFYVDGTLARTLTLNTAANGVQSQWYVSTTGELAVTVPAESAQLTTEDAPIITTAFTPTAVLDPSLNALAAVPIISDDADVWAVVQDIADAEGARAGFDELGIFRFRNRRNAPAAATSTISSRTNLTDLDISESMDDVADTVSARVAQLLPTDFVTLWSAASTYRVPARATLDIVVDTVAAVAAYDNRWTEDLVGSLRVSSTYRASSSANGRGLEVADLDIDARQIAPQRFVISISNPHTFPVFMVGSYRQASIPSTSIGQPALWLRGVAMTATGTLDDTGTGAGVDDSSASSGTTVVSASSTSRRAVSLPDSSWRQSTVSAQGLTDDLLADLRRPKPVVQDLPVLADPRRQLGDRARLKTFDGYVHQPGLTPPELDDDVLVVGIELSGSRDGWMQTLTVRSLAVPGQWILGQPGRSELGATTVL